MSLEPLIALRPETISALGWTLVHFLWQGAALALLLYIVTAFFRSAVMRYWLGVGTLTFMLLLPVTTFVVLSTEKAPDTAALSGVTASVADIASTYGPAAFTSTSSELFSVNWLRWFAAIWFAGVLTFGLRALGGWVLVQRLWRIQRQPLAPSLATRCQVLKGSLGITRRVQFYLSNAIDAPAVIGWFRPVVLLPFSALTGLSPEQLEAILIHELAHIKRLDCFVNLFQIIAETLLFYHPAVWWVNHMVRTERENCCDDIAVSLCGDIGVYARALTVIESRRAMPSLVLAANGSSLKRRIERLLGIKAMASNLSLGSVVAVALVCATGVLLAGTALHETKPVPLSISIQPTRETVVMPAFSARPATVTIASSNHRKIETAMLTPVLVSTAAQPAETENHTTQKTSYIDELQAAGLKNLTPDNLIALKVQGVTPAYIRDIHALGLTPDVDKIIAMKIQGVTPEYAGKIRESWPGISADEMIALKIQGFQLSDIANFKSVGLEKLDVRQMISFRVQGVTPEYVRSLQGAGLENLNAEQIIAAKVQGVTPEFIQQARAHGFTNLSFNQLIGLKMAGVF